MSAHIHRAHALMAAARHDLAEAELRQELAAVPDNAVARSLLALCLAERRQFAAAADEARQGVALAGDDSFAHYALAQVLYHRDDLAGAAHAIAEAIHLDPNHADHHAWQAAILVAEKRWAEALAAAEAGLSLDAEHALSNNCRAIALVKLGRRAEAGQTIEATLARDPEDGLTHANMGWTCLEQNDPPRALEHFREALRLTPNLEWARVGTVEALKAHYRVYSWLLRYGLWMSKLRPGMQLAVMIGGFVLYQVGIYAHNHSPTLAPWLLPFLVAYFLFALTTWFASPFFNLLLRFNDFGRHTLSRAQIACSDCIALGGCIGLVSFGYWLLTDDPLALIVACSALFVLYGVKGAFDCAAGWPRIVMVGYAIGQAALALLCITLLFLSRFLQDELLSTLARGLGLLLLTEVLLYVSVAGMVLAVLLPMARPKK